ncbi:MAG: phosphoadenylyl-sulfate reductase [Firmicutes bacterium]|nr:phosphoadenylyl-sulfate reductase [Bacillota bacterium]
MNCSELNSLSQKMETWDPERILLWAAERFSPRLVVTCSFGGAGTVLAHFISRHQLPVPILFVDTGFHFAQTLQFRRELASHWGLTVIEVRAEESVAEQERRLGPKLYERDPDLCCRLRKVEPLARALNDLDVAAWAAALRRDQSPARRNIQILEFHEVPPGRRLVKIHPLANWTREDVWRYIHRHGLPYHPLLDEGYTSIGCWPCTQPVRPGDPERSGRWPGLDKTECGLHTFSRRILPPEPGM